MPYNILNGNYIGAHRAAPTNPVQVIISAFKTRVASDAGTFEAESCLNTAITNLRNIDLA
jgi:hypothetical protein